jgi:hypothetical protein
MPATFDHKLLDDILQAAVKDRAVDYRVVAARRAELDKYLALLAAADAVSLGDDERMAFWTNAYNALVLRSFVAHELHTSKKRVIDVPGFFDKDSFKVAGETLTLNELEERKLRLLDKSGMSKNPRVHFVVNCASRDCPPLAPRAYTGARWKKDVDERTRSYLQRPGEVAMDGAGHRILVVQLFEWYASDFGGESGVRRFLADYVPAMKDALLDEEAWDLDYRPYDWSSNAL